MNGIRLHIFCFVILVKLRLDWPFQVANIAYVRWENGFGFNNMSFEFLCSWLNVVFWVNSDIEHWTLKITMMMKLKEPKYYRLYRAHYQTDNFFDILKMIMIWSKLNEAALTYSKLPRTQPKSIQRPSKDLWYMYSII